MDDDDVQESGTLSTEDAAPKPTTTTPSTANAPATASEEVPPPKPPRPLTEAQKNQQTLKEAFPSVDNAVIKAVLTASGGRIEAAFNALLEMTDPEAAERDQPPPPPPRPLAEPVGPTSTDPSQLEADERYARQLAEHYENVGAYEARTSNRAYRGTSVPRGRHHAGTGAYDQHYEREHSFIEDDLPVIKESLRKGFLETQTKVNTWFNNLKKKIDEQFEDAADDDDDDDYGQGSSSFIGRPSRNQSRRSADYDRYDADPELLSDDFAGMKFHSDGSKSTVRRRHSSSQLAPTNRPPAPARNQGPLNSNPTHFRPPPASRSPKPSDGRRVAFRETVEDIDAYNASPRLPPKNGSSGAPAPVGGAAKSSKWQPLSAVEPSPIAENDPFSLGDSDDEREVRDKTPGGKGDTRTDDSERLRQATADAMADSLVDDDKTKKAGGSSK